MKKRKMQASGLGLCFDTFGWVDRNDIQPCSTNPIGSFLQQVEERYQWELGDPVITVNCK